MASLIQIFDGIDFSDSKVQLFSLFFVFVIALTLSLIVLGFKLFIPKSKIKDSAALEVAIRRLRVIILFDRIMLIVLLMIAFLLLVMSTVFSVDIFESPWRWISLLDAGFLIIFIFANFGFTGRSNNQYKLVELQRRKNELESK